MHKDLYSQLESIQQSLSASVLQRNTTYYKERGLILPIKRNFMNALVKVASTVIAEGGIEKISVAALFPNTAGYGPVEGVRSPAEQARLNDLKNPYPADMIITTNGIAAHVEINNQAERLPLLQWIQDIHWLRDAEQMALFSIFRVCSEHDKIEVLPAGQNYYVDDAIAHFNTGRTNINIVPVAVLATGR